MTEIWTRCARQWKWMSAGVVLTVVTGSGMALFGGYLPKTTVDPGQYLFGPLMTVAAAITLCVSPQRVFDGELMEDHFDDLPKAYVLRFAPIAGLIAWLSGMSVWIKYLHGWTPADFSFFVSNPYGIFLLSLGAGFFAMRLIDLLVRAAMGNASG